MWRARAARWLPDVLGCAIVSVVILAYFQPALSNTTTWSTIAAHQTVVYPWRATAETPPHDVKQSDQADLSYPWQMELQRAVRKGTIPWWDDGSFGGGYPLYANGSSGFAYPVRLLL